MKKIINSFLKYLIISIICGVLYGIINYCTNTVVDIKEIAISSVILFIFLCLLVLIGPFLRKLLGYENKE
jgi:hypothetical protein